MQLSEKIYLCRKKAGLSQEALAEQMNVSRQAVSKWETGESEPELGKLRQLAAIFGVSADWLLSDQEEPETPPAQAAPPRKAGFLDSMPRFLVRAVKKFGWLYGVYVAIGGFFTAIIGVVTQIIVNVMVENYNRQVAQMHQMQSQVNEAINSWDNEWGFLFGDMGASGVMPDVTSIANASTVAQPMVIFSTFMIVIGLVVGIAGVALAIYLKKLGAEKA